MVGGGGTISGSSPIDHDGCKLCSNWTLLTIGITTVGSNNSNVQAFLPSGTMSGSQIGSGTCSYSIRNSEFYI